MSSLQLPLHVLLELPNITDIISSPLKSSQRIKYTCFDVSKTLIVFGATSGGIYVFNRKPCEFVQLIPSKDGAITRLAISPNEQHIGFANGRGVVTVTEQKLSGSHKSVSSRDHFGNEVTALAWAGDAMLFCGDDVGKLSVLQLPNFITKTMFQSASQTIMSLDSRVCQLDVKDTMLLVSTLTRCYICDTTKEQYRQIGQKLRDGEYGACFVTTDRRLENGTMESNNKDYTEVKQFNIVDGDESFAVSEKLANVAIFCARPSSRLWEASIDGTVQRTHQFKQVLARKPFKVITAESYANENVIIEKFDSNVADGQSCNFPKIYSVNNGIILSFKKDALFFLDVEDVDNTMWFDAYKEIIECKMFHDFVYLWLQNGSVVCLKYMKIDKFVIKCFLDQKFALCSDLCSMFASYLLTNDRLSPKLNIVAGLRKERADLTEIEEVLQKFESLRSDATLTKSGIYVVDNTYHNRETLLSECEDDRENGENKHTAEPLQTLKDLMSTSMTDTLNSSKKILKEKWEGFEVKMKHLSGEKQAADAVIPKRIGGEAKPNDTAISKKIVEEVTKTEQIDLSKNVDENHVNEGITNSLYKNDIIFKESSQKAIDVSNEDLELHKVVSEKDRVCRALYHHFRLSLLDAESEDANILSLLDSYSCDINEIYELMLLFEEYCIKIGALEESKYAPNSIFLTYLNLSPNKDILIDKVITHEGLYKYFVDCCILVNVKTQKLSNLGCECGFPLPYVRTHQNPAFSRLIDQFIERQWASHTKEQCYDMCKKMPYLWRKILYLRRNEDLMNILRLLLQMLDEKLLHSFLPQFTLETWDKAVQLYAVLHANRCLNCNRVFDHISVRHTLSWDDIGSLLIKSVGGRNAIKVMEKNAELIAVGEISMRFYHACILVAIFEKYDGSLVGPLTDTIYSCYGSEEARIEICRLIKSTANGTSGTSALPLIVAANSEHWGLTQILKDKQLDTRLTAEARRDSLRPHVSLVEILDILDGNTDCDLCGLPLVNEVLIKDGGLWAFKCGHLFHGACLELNKLRLCPSCSAKQS